MEKQSSRPGEMSRRAFRSCQGCPECLVGGVWRRAESSCLEYLCVGSGEGVVLQGVVPDAYRVQEVMALGDAGVEIVHPSQG